MKKWMWIVLGVALALLLVLVAVVIWVAGIGGGGETMSLQDYITEDWSAFGWEDYDEDTGTLTLSYTTSITFAQAQKYGKDSGYEEVALGHVETINTILACCAANCKPAPKDIVICGYSTDGEKIYTIDGQGDLWACWQQGDE